MQPIATIFQLQKENQSHIARSTVQERCAKLELLRKAITVTFREQIRAAMAADFSKGSIEVDLTEIFVVSHEIKHVCRHLRRWAAPQRVATPLPLLGSSSWILPEPKGVCLIISPWNFPVNLTLCPLVSAIAAGNTAILKPSELTPHTSAVLRTLIESIFRPEEVAVVEGGIEASQALLSLPFDHIFFTGSPAVGKIVMAAAAKHLASVTLELGGKSPVIVDETANIKQAGERIAWGKFLNSGQICIAPDYIFVHESKKQDLIAAIRAATQGFFGEKPAESAHFTHVVNAKHFSRLSNYLDDARQRGSAILMGGNAFAGQNTIEPTLVDEPAADSLLMQEEIFGPILPIKSYSKIEEVLRHVNSGEKPLALYVYSRSEKNIEHILKETSSGGVAINHNAVHFFNNNLPFGGVNNSGIGKSHGKFGFEAFSNMRGVYRQNFPGALELLMPPYNGFKQWLTEFTVRWF